MRRALATLLVVGVLLYAGVVAFFAFDQRELLYHPTHTAENHHLPQWEDGATLLGLKREVAHPHAVWLVIHGNAGEAGWLYPALPRFSPDDSVYLLEHPGFGARTGEPTQRSLNAAAAEGYGWLRAHFPGVPVCVAAESLGTGPACFLTHATPPPDKIALAVPYDRLSSVAWDHYPFLPTRWIMRDDWDNVAALAGYRGPIDLFAGTYDRTIPVAHAKRLAATVPQAHYVEYPAGHGEWKIQPLVKFRFP